MFVWKWPKMKKGRVVYFEQINSSMKKMKNSLIDLNHSSNKLWRAKIEDFASFLFSLTKIVWWRIFQSEFSGNVRIRFRRDGTVCFYLTKQCCFEWILVNVMFDNNLVQPGPSVINKFLHSAVMLRKVPTLIGYQK